jgi:F-type H+-transporting ATPase subunit delta
MPAAIASRYARALADLLMRPASGLEPERAVAELESFAGALKTSGQLQHVLLSPAVPPPRKRALVTRLVAGLELSDLTKRFLYVLVDHRRIALLADVREAFETEIDQRRGLVRVDAASARELTAAQQEGLARELSRLTGQRPRLRFSIQPDLLGGLVARVGSTVYDGSVRGQLAVLRARLAGEH